MFASLSLSCIMKYSFLNLHVFSDSNRYVVVRLYNEEIKMVRTFSWYVWKGENNKVLNQEGILEEKWVLLDIIDFEGRTLFESHVPAA